MTCTINIDSPRTRKIPYIECFQTVFLLINTNHLMTNMCRTSTIIGDPNTIIRRDRDAIRSVRVFTLKLTLKSQTSDGIKTKLSDTPLLMLSTFLEGDPCIPIRINGDIKR